MRSMALIRLTEREWQPQVSDSLEHPVEGGLVRNLAGDDGCPVSRLFDGHAFEPGLPVLTELSCDPDRVGLGPGGGRWLGRCCSLGSFCLGRVPWWGTYGQKW